MPPTLLRLLRQHWPKVPWAAVGAILEELLRLALGRPGL